MFIRANISYKIITITICQVHYIFLREQLTTLTEYDEQLIRRLIEKVVVYEDRFTVEFKSSVMVDVEE